MKRQRIMVWLGLVMVIAMLVSACAAPVVPAAAPAGEAAATTEPAAEDAAAAGEPVEIEYWQYNFESRITAMDELIALFEAENPGIKVIHNSEIPYDNYRDKIAASVPAGVGPDVATLFYGWQPAWVDAGYLVPLPADAFPPEMVNSEFSPMVQASYQDGELYTLPTAVRTLALFYNKDLMTAAGLDPENPPTTLAELDRKSVV